MQGKNNIRWNARGDKFPMRARLFCRTLQRPEIVKGSDVTGVSRSTLYRYIISNNIAIFISKVNLKNN